MTDDAKPSPTRQLLDSLKAVRDSARLELHLLSVEARQRWQELESKLFDLEAKLEHGGDRIAESLSGSAREVTHAVRELLGEAGALELATPVNKVMSPGPSTCSKEDSLARAAQIMWEADCGAVPVVDAEGHLVGIVTDRDICMASHTRGQPPSALTVESTMSRDVCSASPDDSIGRVARLMRERQLHRIPITEQGRLVGIVALADLARHLRRTEGNSLPASVALAHTLASISEGRANAAVRTAAE